MSARSTLNPYRYSVGGTASIIAFMLIVLMVLATMSWRAFVGNNQPIIQVRGLKAPAPAPAHVQDEAYLVASGHRFIREWGRWNHRTMVSAARRAGYMATPELGYLMLDRARDRRSFYETLDRTQTIEIRDHNVVWRRGGRTTIEYLVQVIRFSGSAPDEPIDAVVTLDMSDHMDPDYGYTVRVNNVHLRELQ